jgi:integrase
LRHLIFPNGVGGVEGHFLRKLQAIAGRAGVMGPKLHGFRKTYADTLSDEHLAVLEIMKRLGQCSLDVTLGYLRGRELKANRNKTLLTSRRSLIRLTTKWAWADTQSCARCEEAQSPEIDQLLFDSSERSGRVPCLI